MRPSASASARTGTAEKGTPVLDYLVDKLAAERTANTADASSAATQPSRQELLGCLSSDSLRADPSLYGWLNDTLRGAKVGVPGVCCSC
jgi:hypothetical protein